MNEVQFSEDIEFEDKASDEEVPSPEIPKEVRKLRTQAYDKSVLDLIRMIREDDLLLDPDYQRDYIWNNKKASLLVESILLNVPIPVIYVSEDEESCWSVVDGLQRLYSLYRFFANEFRLLEVLSELEGLSYSKLNPKAVRILNNGILRIIVILQESHPEIKYDIFQRLNQSPIRLTEQELRNCVYRGRFINMLKEIRKNPKFLSCMGFKVPQKRFLDAELILRYFALADAFNPETGKVRGYLSKMKTFLNAYIEKNKSASIQEISHFQDRFKNTIEKVHLVFGERAFRRVMNKEGKREALLNRALMDVVMVSFDRFSAEEIRRNKDSILNLYTNLPFEDQRFSDSIKYRTSDNKELEYRLSMWIREITKIMNS